MIADTIRNLPVTLADIKRKAQKDEFIHTTKNKIYNKNPYVPEVFSLWDNVFLYNDGVVIPSSQQEKFPRDFHMGHPGKNRTKSLMRCYVYWPNMDKKMDKDIANVVDSYKGCANHGQKKKKKTRTNRGKGSTSTLLVLWMTSTISLSSTATLNGRKSWNVKDLPQIPR